MMPLMSADDLLCLAQFVADHPFYFAIRDRQTGAVLFLGRLNNFAAEGPAKRQDQDQRRPN